MSDFIRVRRWRATGLLLAAVGIAGCTELPTPPSEPATATHRSLAGVSDTWRGEVEACKQGPVGTYNFTVSAATTPEAGDFYYPQGQNFSLTVTDPNTYTCKVVWRSNSSTTPDNSVTVAEDVPVNMTVSSIFVKHEPGGEGFFFPGSASFTVPYDQADNFGNVMAFPGPGSNAGYIIKFTNELALCTDAGAMNYGGSLPCVYGKTFTIGPSSMEGHIKIPINSWFNGGYSFKFKNSVHSATQFTVAAKVEVPVTCPYGGGPGGTIVIPLGTVTYNVPANNTNWLPTGDANNILSWMGAVRSPDLCGGYPMDNARGAVFTATVAQNPVTGSLVDFRFKYRDPAAKGKVDTNCTDPNEPKRNDAATCGASWSQTVTDP